MSYTYFDRFDICEAHYVFGALYSVGGDTPRHDINRLSRMGFKPSPMLSLDTLSRNGLAIYGKLALREMGPRSSWPQR